jgi:trans-feruloyl-CoA hydratase/vanillin synthase
MTWADYETVKIDREDGIAWVILNRPEKRNAMNPKLNSEMCDVLGKLESDPEIEVVVLTGAGDSFSAGMDLKEYFRDQEGKSFGEQRKVRFDAQMWQYHQLRMFPKATIAMVNGWCFGGAFTPLISCDIAIAAEEAVFGLSEVNWGILPGGVVARDLAMTLSPRDALFYVMTGRPFDGKQAAAMKLVNYAVPAARLRDEVLSVAADLKKKNPATLRACKQAFKMAGSMDWEQAWDYLAAKNDQILLWDAERAREKGIRQFIDEKAYKPGLGPHDRDK